MIKRCCFGLFAHVDSGKTTLSEAMLYTGGAIRKLGRVDRGDAFLDTYELEKKRGITIFSKQAQLKWNDMEITLLDTPGHVDFSAEMERTIQVLDYAILLISGSEGVQGHTQTLWSLLKRYQVPTFLFVNKMDLADGGKDAVLEELKKHLDGNCVDFGTDGSDDFYENAAMCDEEVLERYLETGEVETETVRKLIRERKLFPCYFGSALKMEGIEDFMAGMEKYVQIPEYPEEFGAKIFKIARDGQGNRLTYLKVTGGTLKVKDIIDEEKVNQIRIYSGEKFDAVPEAPAGTVCAVTGLTKTVPGRGIGMEEASQEPVLEPVLTYKVILPEGTDAAAMLPKLLELEEEEPELHIAWEEEKQEIHVQLMGEIHMEILKSLIEERFGISVSFGERSIVYKETIKNRVEGVGHYEPLRHYAEVHLLLEPGERGSGLVFDTACSEDILDKNWQRLVLTHLEEKEHRGVLTGSPITDMRITLMSGRAHVKHTAGGDFRQSVYRAVRQGLMQAESVLLEPFYSFYLDIPETGIGRAMTDIERMNGTFEAPEVENGRALIRGTAPVATMDEYQTEVTAYTGGRGKLTCTLKGYGVCHNPDEVIAASGYDPEADSANPTGSVFCSHGAGFVVKWNEVPAYMHLESCLTAPGRGRAKRVIERGARTADGGDGESDDPHRGVIGIEEIDAILARTSGANKKDKDGKRRWGSGKKPDPSPVIITGTAGKSMPARKKDGRAFLLVDGYNIIFTWEELRELAAVNIDSARGRLMDILCNYQGTKKCDVILVFDAYRVQGHKTEISDYHNIHVVFTQEAETADRYIEKFAHENGRVSTVTVATSDRLEQIIIRGQGCSLLSARELEEEIRQTETQVREHLEQRKETGKRYLFDTVSPEIREKLESAEKTPDEAH